MLREELNEVISAFRSAEYPYLIGKKPRGKIYMESVDLVAHKRDGQLIGTACSIPVYRKVADLGGWNGAYEYDDEFGNMIFTGGW